MEFNSVERRREGETALSTAGAVSALPDIGVGDAENLPPIPITSNFTFRLHLSLPLPWLFVSW